MTNKKSYLKSEEGGVLIFMALAIAVLIVAVGLAIDAGRIFLVNSRAQTALDAAVISAAAVSFQPVDASDRAELNTLLEQRGDDFFVANFPSGFMGVSVGAENATFTAADENGTAVRGDLNLTVNTFFGDFAMSFVGGSGLDNINMDEFAEVVRVIPDIDLEISLALDYTESMCPGGNCSVKFGNLRNSVNLLIDTLEGSLQATEGDSTIHYAFVPFTHTVKLDGNLTDVGSGPGGVLGSAFNATVNSLPNVRGLRNGASNINVIRNDLANIEPDEAAISGTNVAVGAFWGWQALRRNSAGLFRGSSAHQKIPAPMRTAANEEDTYKMLLLLTDGENESWFLNVSASPPWRQRGHPEADSQQVALCEGAKREGIEVRTIAFGIENAAARNRLEQCASVRDGVRFYYEIEDADDEDELRDAFREIANDLVDLRIRK